MPLTMTQVTPVFKEIRPLEAGSKVVLINGGAFGIGLVMAEMLVKKNIKVAISGRYAAQGIQAWEKLEKIGGGDVAFISGDISEYNDCRQIVRETTSLFRRLDAVINCGETSVDRTSGQISTRDCAGMNRLDLKEKDYISEIAVPEMRKVGGGAIVTVSDYAAKSGSKLFNPGDVPSALGEAITLEMVPCDVHLNIACHGNISKDKFSAILSEIDYRKRHIDKVKSTYRVKTCSNLQEVAQIICFLVSATLCPVANGVRMADGGLMVC
jgi:NAD(P)-dependent dehydrogenase (short-subunit alcohol dehydrogenase family)